MTNICAAIFLIDVTLLSTMFGASFIYMTKIEICSITKLFNITSDVIQLF